MTRDTFNRLLKENDITEDNDSLAYTIFNYWYDSEDTVTDRSDNCLTFKMKEYTFCRESKSLGLPFVAEMNWGSKFGSDIFLRSNTYNYIAADYKVSRRIFHPYKPNKWLITAHNCFSLKLQQLERYCRDGLQYIVCDRDIHLEDKENQKALEFLAKYNWAKEKLEVEEKRTIIVIDVARLCDLLGNEEEIIHQTVPKHLRKLDINGKQWDGRCIFFSYEIFPSFDITKTKEKKISY